MLKKIMKHLPALIVVLALVLNLGLPLLANASGVGNLIGNGVDEVANGSGYNTNGGDVDLMTIIGNVIKVLLGFLGALAVILIIYAGFMYMTAQGDPAKTKKAKDLIVDAVIGIAIILAAYAITDFVISKLAATVGQ